MAFVDFWLKHFEIDGDIFASRGIRQFIHQIDIDLLLALSVSAEALCKFFNALHLLHGKFLIPVRPKTFFGGRTFRSVLEATL